MLGSEAVLKDTVTMGDVYGPEWGADPGVSDTLEVDFLCPQLVGTGSWMVMTTLDYEIGS